MIPGHRCYLLLEVGGKPQIYWSRPADIDTLKDYMNAVLIGEGATREEAIRDAYGT